MASIELTASEQALVELFESVEMLAEAVYLDSGNNDATRGRVDVAHSRVIRAKSGYIKALAEAARVQL